ncbi:hypothetical protein ACOME3_009752 [Neoechinorhynchus agilis]
MNISSFTFGIDGPSKEVHDGQSVIREVPKTRRNLLEAPCLKFKDDNLLKCFESTFKLNEINNGRVVVEFDLKVNKKCCLRINGWTWSSASIDETSNVLKSLVHVCNLAMKTTEQLSEIIKSKDRELEDYRAQGCKLTRQYLDTTNHQKANINVKLL